MLMKQLTPAPFFKRHQDFLLFAVPVLLVYLVLVISHLNGVYFWDNVQQTSREAHWFYQQQFSSFWLPGFSDGEEITGTAYHFPLIGMMTAGLWMVLGQHLWVSHVFIGFWSVLLVLFTHKLFRCYLSPRVAGWALLVLLLESTLLTQIAIASPDVILLTALVMALYGIVNRRRGLTSMALLFLVLINGRGMLAGPFVYLFAVLHKHLTEGTPLGVKMLWRTALPFVPAYSIYGLYIGLYLLNNGWFLNQADSPWSEGWQSPQGLMAYLKNFAAFGLRLLENGRFALWLSALVLITQAYKRRTSLIGKKELPLVVLVGGLILLFLYFALSTVLVIGSRYYMGITLVLGLLVFVAAERLWCTRRIQTFALVVGLLFVGGHAWVYPSRVSVAWDATLAHTPYYTLREQLLTYLEQNHIDEEQVGGGFLFSGNQRYVDLKDRDLRIGQDHDKAYFIYSNLSNLSDDLIDELENRELWEPVEVFSKGPVFISLLRNQKIAP